MHGSTLFEVVIEAIPPILGRQGRPRIKSRIARRGIESSEKLGHHRWVVERRADIHQAF